MKARSVSLYTINVLPFTLQEMNELMIEMIHWTGDNTTAFSDLVKVLYEKSQGIVFFFLKV
jgi:hypothetical protein